MAFIHTPAGVLDSVCGVTAVNGLQPMPIAYSSPLLPSEHRANLQRSYTGATPNWLSPKICHSCYSATVHKWGNTTDCLILFFSPIGFLFVFLHSNSGEKSVCRKMQEKHCEIVPFTEFRQNSYGRIEHYCFRLVVYAIGSRLRHIFRREICSKDPVPVKVFGDTW